MCWIITFFSSSFFIVVGGITICLTIIGILYGVYLVVKGVLPICYRLGMGLAKRRIGIFADSDYSVLEKILIDSGLFKKKNIIQIRHTNLKEASNVDIFLIHWKYCQENIEEILRLKKSDMALVVYAPQNEGRVSDSIIEKINTEQNAILVNFRGRLLNDILTSLMTISFQNKK